MHNTTNAVLNRMAARHALRSDYAISKALGRTPTTVYNYRAGRSQMDEGAAVRAAELAELPPAAVLAELQAERSTSPEAKTHWIRLAELARADFEARRAR